AGSHPLQLLVAEQALEAGGEVAVVAFIQPFSTLVWRALARPWTALTHWPVLLSALGSAWRLFRAGVPLRFGRAALSVEGLGRVALVTVVQPFSTLVCRSLARPWTALTHWPVLLSALGSAWRLFRAGVPLRFGRAALSVEGQGRVAALRLSETERFDCDAVALCFGFMPQADLPRAAGLQVTSARPGGWKASHDEWMR